MFCNISNQSGYVTCYNLLDTEKFCASSVSQKDAHLFSRLYFKTVLASKIFWIYNLIGTFAESNDINELHVSQYSHDRIFRSMKYFISDTQNSHIAKEARPLKTV
jgi:hypothetical protein